MYIQPDRYMVTVDLNTLNGVEDQIDPLKSVDYNLCQNYPNPFNPTTNIEYNIPKSTYVNLEVYNILGKNVATLVDKFQQAGKKSVEFNASKLPSGVYFYRLQAGSFIETKKLILLK